VYAMEDQYDGSPEWLGSIRQELAKLGYFIKELEPSLFIESIKLETEKTKDKTIEILQAQIQKMQDRMERIELLNKE